jgi:hypothetical protein
MKERIQPLESPLTMKNKLKSLIGTTRSIGIRIIINKKSLLEENDVNE